MVSGELVRVRKAARSVIVEFGSEVGVGWRGRWNRMDGLPDSSSLRLALRRPPMPLSRLAPCAQDEEFGQDDLEPPIPAGLGELSAPLHALIEFLGIDEDLVEVAAQTSKSRVARPSAKELSKWVRRLPEKDKNELLITAALEPGEHSRRDFMRRFQRENSQHPSQTAATARRSVGDILAVATRERRKESSG